MPKVITLSEDIATMTHEEGLAFIERTRRQLDRFARLPNHEGQIIRPEYDAEIRRICDDLEQDVQKSLSKF